MIRKITFSLCLLIASRELLSQDNFKIQRNITTPLSHVFDPSSDITPWVHNTEGQMEMPLPGGMKESIRKKVDVRRSQHLQKEMVRRGNHTGTPTNPDSIKANNIDGFDGTSGGGTPNDNHIAVGKSGFVISVMNTVIRITNDTGKLLRAWSLENFTNVPNKKIDPFPTLTRVYDPRVVYDPDRDRFIVLFMHGTTDKTSFIVVGFSQTNDPTKGWNVYKIPGKPTPDLIWSDYPIVAHNSHDLFFTVNLIGNDATWEEGFTEAIIWQLNKEDGFKGDSLHKDFYSNIKYKGTSLRSICAIQNGPMPRGTDNFFVSVKPIDEINDTVFLLHINNTQQSGQAQLNMKVLVSPMKYGFPPSALQPDTSYKLRTNDARVLSAIRVGNTVQYMQNSINFNTFQAHLTHNTIYNPFDEPRIEAGMITDDSLDFGYPAIAAASMDENDPSVIITMVYSSPWHFPGTAVVYRNRYGEYSKVLKVKEGSSLIHYTYIPKGEQRWGDYEGIQAKYDEPGVFYAVGSYGRNRNMNAWVAKITLSDKALGSPIQDVRVFPVPALKDLYVEIKVTKPGKFQVDLVDMTGKTIKGEQEMAFSEGIQLVRIDPITVANGTYVLRVKDNGNVIFKTKVIFQ